MFANLATLVKNRVIPRGADSRAGCAMVPQPTKLQERAFGLLGLPLTGM